MTQMDLCKEADMEVIINTEIFIIENSICWVEYLILNSLLLNETFCSLCCFNKLIQTAL